MNTSRHPPAPARALPAALWLLAAFCTPAVPAQPGPAVANPAASAAEVFRRLAGERWIARESTLADLGFTAPVVLGAPDTAREIYLPVPPNVPLSDAGLQLNGSYMRADGGRTSMLVSLDTYPVSSRAFAQDKGDAGITLGVDNAPRASGFVRLGLNWTTALGADWLCGDGRTPGNVLRIEPDSRFTYRYDGGAIRDLSTAWGALPTAPVILVSSRNLASPAYDTAWRLGLALERAGKHASIRAFPAVGDTVDLRGVDVPAALRGLAAFSALSQGGTYRIRNVAEVGALAALGAAGPLRGDIVIADAAMGAAMTAALDAAEAQVQASAPDALGAFTAWRAQRLDALAPGVASKEVRIAWAFGAPSILVAADAGAQAAGLFSTYWSRMAMAPGLVVQAAAAPGGAMQADASAVSLQYLGGKPGTINVLAHADWSAAFGIGAVAAAGRLPARLVLDVAAAPGAARTPPVVSLYMNDILLGAKQMDANGRAERISATIPRYALAARNVLRVAFVRQLASDRCRETPEAYPVSVLPSSHMLLEQAAPTDDFNGMAARFADGAHVLVPASYLADAPATLPRVIRLAATVGISPLNARFTAVNGDMPVPGGSFLVLDLPFSGSGSRIALDAGHLVMAGGNGKPLLDVATLDRVGIVEVVRSGGDTGVSYRAVGTSPPAMDQAILLGRGDVAVLGSTGLLAEIDSADPEGRAVLGGREGPWLLARGYWWMVPILLIAFMIALLVFASRVRRRNAAQAGTPLAPTAQVVVAPRAPKPPAP